MNIVIRESTLIRPAVETPKINLWLSDMDLLVPKVHTRILYFYRPTGASSCNFFDAKVMKDALSKVLVPFYPVGGRLKKDQDGRTEINCQGQGVLFVEAESDGLLDDFTDFAPKELQILFPSVDHSLGSDSYPLLLVQVSYFKCGEVSLGVAIDHHVGDALSIVHFINSWSELARGLDITQQPFIDRTRLRARDPPQPIYEHSKFQCMSSMKSSSPVKSSVVDNPVTTYFRLTRDQLNFVATKSKEDKFTSYEMLAAHIWRSVCKARGLQDDEVTRLVIPAEVRAHLRPSLPPSYFGNAVSFVNVIDVAGKVKSNPTLYAMNRIHEEIAGQRKNDYIKSFIDYLELAPALDRRYDRSCPFLVINSWAKFKWFEADFGWGAPVNVLPANIQNDGMCFILPSRINNESMSFAMTLQAPHMKLFSVFLYDI